MTEIGVAQPPAAANSTRPYTPSWFDRFTDWVEHLSIPVGLFYVGFAAILAGIQLVIQWNGSVGTVYTFPLVYILTIAYCMALMHYLDKVAAQALVRFRPLVSMSDPEYDTLLYRLTTLPARPALLAGLMGALFGISTLNWIPVQMKTQELHFADTALSLHFNHGLSLFIWGIIGVLFYHTVHQLRIVQQIYSRHSRIDLYTLGPVYAFSTLSAWTAIGIALIIYVWYGFAPPLFEFGLSGLVFFTGFSLLTFALPLQSARRLLVEEKDRQLIENGERQRTAVVELHRRVDAQELADMDNLNKTMASLELEHATLDRISTWPWKPETVRAVAAALFFPVVVWLMQWLLQRVLGP